MKYMKTIACREVGLANCDHVVEGETEEEVMKRGAEHGKNVHGMKDEDFTPEFMQKVRGLIRTS
jgi:predicted small metal-binding protein